MSEATVAIQDNVSDISEANPEVTQPTPVKKTRTASPLTLLKREIKALRASIEGSKETYEKLQNAAEQIKELEASIPEMERNLEEKTAEAMELMKADLGL